MRRKRIPYVSIVILALIAAGCLIIPEIYPHDAADFYLDSILTAPNTAYPFGTDSLGRDLFACIWYGGRISLGIGLLGAAINSVIGISYGCISGAAPAWLDRLMMRAVELLSSMPSILIILLLGALLPQKNILSMSLLIGVTGWFPLARLVRSEVQRIRRSEYVLTARLVGVPFYQIMVRHMLPNFLPAILFMIVSSVGAAITAESTLSFLGLGLPADVISWGTLLSLANRALLMKAWWVIVIPGLFLVITLGCITGIGGYWRQK